MLQILRYIEMTNSAKPRGQKSMVSPDPVCQLEKVCLEFIMRDEAGGLDGGGRVAAAMGFNLARHDYSFTICRH